MHHVAETMNQENNNASFKVSNDFVFAHNLDASYWDYIMEKEHGAHRFRFDSGNIEDIVKEGGNSECVALNDESDGDDSTAKTSIQMPFVDKQHPINDFAQRGNYNDELDLYLKNANTNNNDYNNNNDNSDIIKSNHNSNPSPKSKPKSKSKDNNSCINSSVVNKQYIHKNSDGHHCEDLGIKSERLIQSQPSLHGLGTPTYSFDATFDTSFELLVSSAQSHQNNLNNLNNLDNLDNLDNFGNFSNLDQLRHSTHLSELKWLESIKQLGPGQEHARVVEDDRFVISSVYEWPADETTGSSNLTNRMKVRLANLEPRAISNSVLRTVREEFIIQDLFLSGACPPTPEIPKLIRKKSDRDVEWTPLSVYKAYTNIKSPTNGKDSYNRLVPYSSCIGTLNYRPKDHAAWKRSPNRRQ